MCGTCEAPVALHPCPEPSKYGEPLAVLVAALLHVIRDEQDAARELVSTWRTGGPSALKADHFAHLAKLMGSTQFGSPLTAASAAAANWLLECNNEHVPESFAMLYERYFIETVWDDPEGLSYLGLLESVGIRGHNRVLSDAPSKAHSSRHQAYIKTDIAILDALEATADQPSAADTVSVGVLRWLLENGALGAAFEHHQYALDQMDGAHLMLQLTMTDLTPVRCVEDAWNYVARLGAFPARLGHVADELRLQVELGILPPKFVLTRVLEKVLQLRDEAQSTPEACALCSTFLERLTEVPEGGGGAVFAEVPDEIRAAACHAVQTDVATAYAGLVAPLEAMLSVASSEGYADHAGVQALPDGGSYYAYKLREQTSTRLSPEEVHALGHAEVERIMGEMAATISKLAAAGDPDLKPEDSVPVNMQRLAKNPRWAFPQTEEGKAACLEGFRALGPQMEARLSAHFDVRPKQPLKICAVPAHMEEGSPAAFYMPPSLDGARDGVFYANLGDLSAQFIYGMRTLYAHEAIPGHHFQLAIQFEMKGLPYFRKAADGFNAFVEGWALYTERLARELSFFATEPDGSEGYDLLGHFGDELMRAARLVVDTGLHFYGWSREQAMQYMESHTILAPSDVVTEVERYCVLPGQATSYKVGQLERACQRPVSINAPLHHRTLALRPAKPAQSSPLVWSCPQCCASVTRSARSLAMRSTRELSTSWCCKRAPSHSISFRR